MAKATLLDIAQQTDPKGNPTRVIEVLHQMNPLLQVLPAEAANAPMGNRVTIRGALPTVQRTKVNQGVPLSKSGAYQHIDTIGMFEAMADIDIKEKLVVGEEAFNNYRWNEESAFHEAFAQQVAEEAIYGDERVNGSGFTGLAARLAALSSLKTGAQVRSAGLVSGSDGTSIYIVDAGGARGAKVIYPEKGAYPAGGEATAGLYVRDCGEVPSKDEDQNHLQVYRTHYLWLVGLAIGDPRKIARLANIDVSDANLESPTQGKLIRMLTDILNAMPSPADSKRVLFTSTEIVSAFFKQAMDKSNAALSMQDYLGKPTAHFWGNPIMILDKVSNNESTVA